MEISRKQALILGSAALLVLVLVAAGGAVYLMLSGGAELKYGTQAALRGALPVTAAAELQQRGVRLAAPLKCADQPGRSKERIRVSCTGTTSDEKPVTVFGSGEKKTNRAYYTILVDGRPVVQNASCLGADCRSREANGHG